MPTSHPPAIQIAGLRKSFKDNHVLRGIDLDIPSGIVFALLGANGAGKTTAINILTTLLPPTLAPFALPATTSSPRRTRFAPRSASLDSSPRSMDCSPARRTSA
jgi:ABC-type sugar transport system ATPase subunit